MARAKSMWDGGSLQEFESDHELPEDLSEGEEAEKKSDKGTSVSSKNDQEMMKEIRKINRNDIGCISQVGSLTLSDLFYVPKLDTILSLGEDDFWTFQITKFLHKTKMKQSCSKIGH